MANRNTPTRDAVQDWVREHRAEFVFSTSLARDSLGLSPTYTSSVLSQLAAEANSGVSKLRTGEFRYEPEYDNGFVSWQSHHRRSQSSRNSVIADVAKTLHENPGTVYNPADMAEATGHIRTSCASAMKRLWEAKDSGITRLAAGVYIHNLATADKISEPGHDLAKNGWDMEAAGYGDPGPVRASSAAAQERWDRSSFKPSELEAPKTPQVGDLLEVIGFGAGAGLPLVKSQDGQVFRLEDV